MSARYWFAVATALVLGASASAAPIGGDVAPACDRVCMTGIVDRYLAALVRHDPSGLPLNRDVKFTENTANSPHSPTNACAVKTAARPRTMQNRSRGRFRSALSRPTTQWPISAR